MVSLTGNHLRCCIARGSTSCLKCGSLFIHITEAKIDNLEGQIIVQE
jgi:hypothetical protein